MTQITRQPVDSSSIRSIGYDAMTQAMEIEFTSGHVYRYQGITPEIYDGLMNAPSIGKHFHAQIRSHHTGTKV